MTFTNHANFFSPQDAQGRNLLVLEPQHNPAPPATAAAPSVTAPSATAQPMVMSSALQQALRSKLTVRSQSSSAPPSDGDAEVVPGQIGDRRSTRSLEALFQVICRDYFLE